MNFYFLYTSVVVFFIVTKTIESANTFPRCGCKLMRKCYKQMLSLLLTEDESPCIEDAAIGTATLIVYLKALKTYCGEYITVISNMTTYEGKHLNEVIITSPAPDKHNINRPIIIIDAGQEGGYKPVKLALLLIQYLVACEESEDIINDVIWVILPCTNPDGMEFARYRPRWRKNCRLLENGDMFGVDISRNFKDHWGSCSGDTANPFSPIYRGHKAEYENETQFISQVLNKYHQNAAIYVSLRRDGHSIGYPYAYTTTAPPNLDWHTKAASIIANKVNTKAISVILYLNDSIHDINGRPHCGHSVDYALQALIPMSFEMKVFPEKRKEITSLFQNDPPGYTNSLYNAYLAALQEFYTIAWWPSHPTSEATSPTAGTTVII